MLLKILPTWSVNSPKLFPRINNYVQTANLITIKVSNDLKEVTKTDIYNIPIPSGYSITGVSLSPFGSSTYNADYSFNSATNLLKINGFNLTYSDSNQITISITTVIQSDLCTDYFGAGSSFVSFIVLIILASITGLIFYFLLGTGETEIDVTMVAVMVIIGAVVLIIGGVIINAINHC